MEGDKPQRSEGVSHTPPAGRGSHGAPAAWVEGGELHMSLDGDGTVTLVPTEHVRLRVNGDEVHRAIEVRSGDRCEVEVASNPASMELNVVLSPDRMEAKAELVRVPARNWVLQDRAPTKELVLRAVKMEEAPPEVELDWLRAQLAEKGVVAGLQEDGLAVLAGGETAAVVVAKGERPVKGTDGRVELLYGDTGDARSGDELEQAGRIDLYDRGEAAWVESGEELAVVHPPVPGRPGYDVTGKELPPRPPRSARLSAGEGVTLLDGDRRALSTRAGRPTLEGPLLKVVPVFSVRGNVDVKSGHVRFRGDVDVMGDVCEQARVESGGAVRVGGAVLEGEVHAGGDVVIRRGVVAGRVQAGRESGLIIEIRSVLEEVVASLQGFCRAGQEVASHVATAGGGRAVKLGPVLRQLAERKFPKLLPDVKRLRERCTPEVKELLPEVYDLAARLNDRLVGAALLGTTAMDPVLRLARTAAEQLEVLRGYADRHASVVAASLQNAVVEVSGSVTLTGHGSYNSTVHAGKGLMVERGFVRGGRVVVLDGEVTAAQLGGPGGAPTRLELSKNGKVTCDRLYPGVIFQFGELSLSIAEPKRSVQAYLDQEGHVVVEGLRWKV